MKKLLTILSLVMSVTAWAQDPYFEVYSGSFESGKATMVITCPEATSVDLLPDDWSGVSILHRDQPPMEDGGYSSLETAFRYFNKVEAIGNTIWVDFDNFPGHFENPLRYYLSSYDMLIDGVPASPNGYPFTIRPKEALPYAQIIKGKLSGSIKVKVTFPDALTVQPSLSSSRKIELLCQGEVLDAITVNSEVTSEGNSLIMTFDANASRETTFADCRLAISPDAVLFDYGFFQAMNISFVAPSEDEEPDDDPVVADFFWIEAPLYTSATVTVNPSLASLEFSRTPDVADSWTLIDATNCNVVVDTATPRAYFRATKDGNTNMSGVFTFEDTQGAVYSVGGDITTLLEREGNVQTLPEPYLNLQTYMSTGVFQRMFADRYIDASQLVLPSTTLSGFCYYEMFSGNYGITQAPALPATNLADFCYTDLFADCFRLEQAPELPATTLASNCYFGMFRNCIRLERAPELPAENLVHGCYLYMFSGCTKLNYIKAALTSWNAGTDYECTKNWVRRVPETGSFYLPESAVKERIENEMESDSSYPLTWKVNDVEPSAIHGIMAPTSAEEAVYDLSGRRSSASAKGVYVVGGRKVLKK